MRRWVQFVLRYRYAVIAVWLGLTGLAAWSASRAEMSTRLGEDMIGDRPEFRRYIERASNFRSDGSIIVGIEDPDMLKPANLARLKITVDELLELEEVGHVSSILSAQRIGSKGSTLHVTEYAREAREHPERAADVLAQMQADELVGPLHIAADGRSHSVLVEFTVDDSRAGEDAIWLVGNSLAVFHEAGYAPEKLHVTGFTAALAESVEQLHFNVKTIFPVVSIILILAVWLLFGRLWPAAVSMAVSMTAVIWTVGFLVAWEGRIHTLVSLTPPVVLIVAFSDVVHLCSAYLMSLGKGRSRDEAILESGSEVGRACLLTSATTFAGFASFGLIPQPAMQSTAIALAFGVAVALLIALTLVPVLFSFGKQPAPLRRGVTAVVHRGMDWLLDWARKLAISRPRTIIVAFGLIGLLAATGAPFFTFEADFYRRFDDSNRLTVDTDWFKSNFSGTNMLELYIETDEKNGLLDADRLRSIAAYQQAIVDRPDVVSATSLVDLFESIHGAMVPELAAEDPLPDNRPLLAQYLLLFESSGGDELDRIVDFPREEMVMGIRLAKDGARFTAQEGLAIQAMAEEHLGPGTRAETTGLVYLLGFFFEEIIDGQFNGLALSFVLIALLMVMGLFSLRVGLLSMIPNLLPVAFIVGLMGFLYEHVDSDVVVILVIAVGIGVDDTIHFLTRFRTEVFRGSSVDSAIEETFSFAGRGILMTTIILVAGFLPLALSSYITMKYLGTLLPIALVVALAADVLLVPAMIETGVLRFRR
jgi:uncharacterized protein